MKKGSSPQISTFDSSGCKVEIWGRLQSSGVCVGGGGGFESLTCLQLTALLAELRIENCGVLPVLLSVTESE